MENHSNLNDETTSLNEKKETANQAKIYKYRARKNLLTQRFEIFTFKAWVAIAYVVCTGLVGYAYSNLALKKSLGDSISFMIIGGIIGVFGYSFFILFARLNIQNSLRWIDYQLAQLGIEELNENIHDDFFTKLVQINFKYIDQYYLQTQEQAAKSFKLAVFASISGLIVLICGIIMLFFKSSDISAGVITAAAGIISQFIGSVFFYLYNQTVIKMSQYHQKLVITQNISLALKISNELEEPSKSKSLELLVERLTADLNKFLAAG